MSTLHNLFQILSEPVRLRLVALLAKSKERACVCELCDTLEERQYNVSRQLRALETAGLVAGTRKGRWVYYQYTAPSGPIGGHLTALLQALEQKQFRADLDRFTTRLRLRERGRCVVWKIPAAS